MAERHVVDLHWDQVWGKFTISVDGVPAVGERHLFGFKRARRYEVSVGRGEVHRVAIEKSKILFTGRLVPETLEFFVDGSPVRALGDSGAGRHTSPAMNEARRWPALLGHSLTQGKSGNGHQVRVLDPPN